MSQVTEQSVRFQTALASIKLIQASAVLDLTEDDFDFLTSNKVWIATDRSRARRCVEACVYGTLDFVGYPRFPAPVEFIAAVIAYYVHPVNIQTACLIMEDGTANGRLHFHAVHFMRTLPTGSVDPNFGRRVRNRRQLNSLQNTWPYGYSMPIAVRYTQDAFSRSGWLWPVDAKGEPLKATSYMAVGFYVAKYVNKKS